MLYKYAGKAGGVEKLHCAHVEVEVEVEVGSRSRSRSRSRRYVPPPCSSHPLNQARERSDTLRRATANLHVLLQAGDWDRDGIVSCQSPCVPKQVTVLP